LKLKSTARKSIATIPTEYQGQERRFAQSVSEGLDTLTGRRGPIIDRAVTFRDLLDTGVLKLASGIASGGGAINVVSPTANPDGGPTELPTKPTITSVSGGFGVIFLQWTLPPYRGHDYVEIFRLQQDDFDAAKEAGAYTRYYGDVYTFADTNVGSNETWYYWVRAVNIDGVEGPFNDTAGSSATTALDYLYVSGLIDDILDDDVNNLGLNTAIDAIDVNVTALENFTGYTSNYTGSSLITRMGAVETVAGNAATSAQLQAESTTRASADSALSASINTLSTTVGSNTAAIQTNVSSINGVEAKYSVKVDNNGHVSGFGLISTANNGAVTSSFIVAADRFAIAKPYNSGASVATRYPFKVFTTATVVNGETIPAGVYIDDAFIHNAQITTAMIKDATITTAKILDLSATKITSGNITIDNSNNISIRQGKTSPSTSGTGFWLGNNNGTGQFYLGNSTEYMYWNGSSLVARQLEIRNSSNQVVMSSGGDIDGTYIQNASVDTLQIAGNAITVPDFGQNGGTYNVNSAWQELVGLNITVSNVGASSRILVFGAISLGGGTNTNAAYDLAIFSGGTLHTSLGFRFGGSGVAIPIIGSYLLSDNTTNNPNLRIRVLNGLSTGVSIEAKIIAMAAKR
jgi:hypothetical protein